MKRKRRQRSRDAHIFEKEKHGHYVEEAWCPERILQVERFRKTIIDPSVGWGTITKAARAVGHRVIGFDLIDRRRHGLGRRFRKLNFLTGRIGRLPKQFDIINNPPFDHVEEFARRALALPGVRKVAMICLARRLNAAHWLEELPLRCIYYMSPRPSMPTGEFIRAVERGEVDKETGEPLKVGGGTQDFVFLIFVKGYNGPTFTRWLHRDRG